MRIVTRPDFDGVVCAALLYDVLDITEPTCWISAADIQSGEWQASPGDVIANLPYHSNCDLWFDHHASNEVTEPFEGCFAVEMSAARVIYEYYKKTLTKDYTKLIEATDRIDAAQLSMGEILDPCSNPYFLLSMTLEDNYSGGETYWNKIVELLRNKSIDEIIQLPDVQNRCVQVFDDHGSFQNNLRDCTIMDGQVSVTDFRKLPLTPEGNRFLVYCLFPDAITNVKLCRSAAQDNIVRCSVGHNIFKRECNVNAGELLKKYNGGGHFGAGGASLKSETAASQIADIIDILNRNIPI